MAFKLQITANACLHVPKYLLSSGAVSRMQYNRESWIKIIPVINNILPIYQGRFSEQKIFLTETRKIWYHLKAVIAMSQFVIF